MSNIFDVYDWQFNEKFYEIKSTQLYRCIVMVTTQVMLNNLYIFICVGNYYFCTHRTTINRLNIQQNAYKNSVILLTERNKILHNINP